VVPISHESLGPPCGRRFEQRLLRKRDESRIRKRKCRRAGSCVRFSYGCPRKKKRSCAMQERDEGQRDGSLLIGLTTKLSGEMLFQEFKRRHVLFAGEGDGAQSSEIRRKSLGWAAKKSRTAAANLRGSA